LHLFGLAFVCDDGSRTVGEKMTTAETAHGGVTQEKQIVLVVDNDCKKQFFTCIFLQRLNYHVFPVKTAEEALAIMELTLPLLIITEISLLQMSGFELLKNVKQTPRTQKVPVLIYTDLKTPTHRKACELAGCAGYLTQPADHNQLYAAVQKATEAEPRSFVRLPTFLDVIVEGPTPSGVGERRGQVTAISEHGMYVSTPDPLPFGTTVPFTLFLDRSLAWGIRLEGKVLHSQFSGGPGMTPGMAVQFTLIRPEDHEAIRTFIGKKLMEGIEVTGKGPQTG